MIYSITNDQFNLGNTFLIWSVHYLSGNDDYYDIRIDAKRPIPDNPLLEGVTAHKMKPNFVRTIDSFLDVLDRIPKDHTINHIKFQIKARSLEQNYSTNHELQMLSSSKGIKCINMTCADNQHLVGFLRHDREQPQWQKDMDIVTEHCKHYWPYFFKNASIFQDRLETFHGIRENIAFNLRFNDFWTHFPQRSDSELVYHCQYNDWVKDGLNEMKKVLQFLGLECKEERIDTWCEIHAVWSWIHTPYLDFCNDIHEIIECIVNNKSMDLTKYNLDVLKEAVILHLLMFKHDLNLKLPVDHLPQDAQLIFSLLEENQRIGLEKLYHN
jgi:hypothetical protein|tara:strand:- start:703 stop:1680 length:978 start_codon:yes stop_codon:yes gene_type:complete